jgi:hypothetical protein
MKQIEFIEKEKRNANLIKYYKDHPGITYRALGAIFKISGARAHIIINKAIKKGVIFSTKF